MTVLDFLRPCPGLSGGRALSDSILRCLSAGVNSRFTFAVYANTVLGGETISAVAPSGRIGWYRKSTPSSLSDLEPSENELAHFG